MSEPDRDSTGWPLVMLNDDGIRYAGAADTCFYCNRKVGEPHERDCVIVHKLVRVRYTFEIDLSIPHYWGKKEFEFHRNSGNWCADNAESDIAAHLERSGETCLCKSFTARFVKVQNATPTRKLCTIEEVVERDALRKEFTVED